jgi:hypothetical protein
MARGAMIHLGGGSHEHNVFGIDGVAFALLAQPHRGRTKIIRAPLELAPRHDVQACGVGTVRPALLRGRGELGARVARGRRSTDHDYIFTFHGA